MANTAQARKRARQAVKRREHNISLRSRMRTTVKKVRAAIVSGDQSAANNNYRHMSAEVDKMVSKGLIHANKAARYKHRLNAQIKVLGETPA